MPKSWYPEIFTLFILALGALTYAYGHRVVAMPPADVFLAVVGLAVAAIPEGLPAIVTITLAIGTRIMARERAIVRRLPAVETLGSVTVICSDKNGTLTKNEMTAVRLVLPDRDIQVSGAGYAPDGGFEQDGRSIDPRRDEGLLGLARCALLCIDAHLSRDDTGAWTLVGDPTEGALMALALKAGLDPVAFWASLVLIGLQLLFTYAPPMQAVFHTGGLDLAAWGLIPGALGLRLLRGGDREGHPEAFWHRTHVACWSSRLCRARARHNRVSSFRVLSPLTDAVESAEISPLDTTGASR